MAAVTFGRAKASAVTAKPETVTLKFNSLTTSKEQAGKAIEEFMRAYEERTGKNLIARPGLALVAPDAAAPPPEAT